MIHFVVHEPGDGVGVVVVEGVKAGTDLTGWVMDGDITLNMKYGVDIGKVVAPIKKGEHLHVQNVKTKRW
jgi:(2R)-sulfolactate sulfo-lyase subunit alpha